MDINLCVTVGKLVREIRCNDRSIRRNQKENDELLNKLNHILTSTGGKELTLEEVLQETKEEEEY